MSAPTIDPKNYPWYSIILPHGDRSIEQGDILEDFRLVVPVDPKQYPSFKDPAEAAYADLIVMSQSCDLANAGIDQVVVCPLLAQSDFDSSHAIGKKGGMENLRKGKLVSFHLLNRCELTDFERDWRIVDFGEIHSIPIMEVHSHLNRAPHLRLLPPYREQLSQTFARFFMRIGLPVDIPPFK